MRTFGLLAVLLLACHGSTEAPEAGHHVTPKAAAIDSAEEEPQEEAEAPAPERPASLRPFDAPAAPRTKDGTAVLLCDTHSTWRPPAGFSPASSGGATFARKDDEVVGVAYPAHEANSFATAVAPFVEGTLAWDKPAMKRRDDWHAEATTHGRAHGLVVAARTLYAGADPKTGVGRAGRDLVRGSADVVWFAIADTDKRADELLAAARADDHPLPDHACACGYDCMPKR